MTQPVPLQMGLPGGPELLIVLLLAVLLFGASKLPRLARSTGEAIGEFEKGRSEVERELQAMREDASGQPDPTEPGESGAETAGFDAAGSGAAESEAAGSEAGGHGGEDPSASGSESKETPVDDTSIDSFDDDTIREEDFVWGG